MRQTLRTPTFPGTFVVRVFLICFNRFGETPWATLCEAEGPICNAHPCSERIHGRDSALCGSGLSAPQRTSAAAWIKAELKVILRELRRISVHAIVFEHNMCTKTHIDICNHIG